MPSLWFCVPVHGRLPLAQICLRQLRRTCDALTAEGIDATAVVVGDDENLETARELGFGTVQRDNEFVSRKFNDGIQLACDPRWNPRPADYVVPCGSDDWVDYRLFLDLPRADTMYGFQHASFVREDGREITQTRLDYRGGCGIRIYPAELMKPLGYRPADEDRHRACDTSILVNLNDTHGDNMRVVHVVSDSRQIVDWKTDGEQLNGYDTIRRRHRGVQGTDPFEVLADVYPVEALEEMRAHYGLHARKLVAA